MALEGISVANPSVRALARKHGVDVDELALELNQDRISEADVLLKEKGGSPVCSSSGYWDVDHAQYGPGEAVAMTRFAQVSAANLTASQQDIPAVTHHDKVCMDAVETFRKDLAKEGSKRGVKVTALVFHIIALTQALKQFPTFNASLQPEGKELWLKHYYDIGIAVDTPHGLMVPVLRRADRKGVWEIAKDVSNLAKRAQDRKIKPHEMGGAGTSISNLGGIGGHAFSPIVNPPEVAILGLSRASMEPVWNGSAFEPKLMCPISLSYDHRVINGAEAARFCVHYAALLSDPRRLLL